MEALPMQTRAFKGEGMVWGWEVLTGVSNR